MPTFTTGPDALADRVDAVAAFKGIATAATSATNTTICMHRGERPTACDERTPPRPFAPMVPPTVTAACADSDGRDFMVGADGVSKIIKMRVSPDVHRAIDVPARRQLVPVIAVVIAASVFANSSAGLNMTNSVPDSAAGVCPGGM